MNNPIRILQIVPTINQTSGVFNVVLNWHKYIDTARIQFDYLYFAQDTTTGQEKEIAKLGGKSFYLSYQNPVRFISNLREIFRENKYETIHSHILQLPMLIFPLAKISGVKNIIQHAHSTKLSDKSFRTIRNYLMLHSVWPLITNRLACSEKAGKFLFGNKFEIIKNGIEIEEFSYKPDVRLAKRKELGWNNAFVIGHVGHLSPEKNHIFLLYIFSEIVAHIPYAKLALVGNGYLESKLKEIVKKKNLTNNVLFLGARNDIPDLLQAFDLFIFPSLFEGMGIAAMEAQAAGLPCLLADTLPLEACVCNYKRLALEKPDEWIASALTFVNGFKRENTTSQINDKGFSSKDIAAQIQNYYLQLGK